MASWWHPEPYAEDYQQAAYNGFPFLPEFGHRRTAPREEPFITWRQNGSQGHGWYKGGRKLHGYKSKKYWARPVDGARKGTWGRIKDGLSGEGPDVFVVANGDRRTLMRDMPHRGNWGHWDSTRMKWLDPTFGGDACRDPSEDMDWYPPANLGSTPWAKRDFDEVYNFRNRRYSDITGRNRWKFWSDAHWPNGERKKYSLPTCWREWDGRWRSTVDGSAGRWPGGRPVH